MKNKPLSLTDYEAVKLAQPTAVFGVFANSELPKLLIFEVKLVQKP